MRPELCDNHDQAAHHHILGILSWGLHLWPGKWLVTLRALEPRLSD
jgi:hypothetical protein